MTEAEIKDSRRRQPCWLGPFTRSAAPSVVLVFFIAFLAVGLAIYDDYGMSWDEQAQRELGFKTLNYVVHSDDTVERGLHEYYGPAFQTVLVLIEKVAAPNDVRKVFLLRHLCTFLFFYLGVLAFGTACGIHFKNWWCVLAGALLLVFHPRILAHSFFNPKDVPFLSALAITFLSGLLMFRYRGIYSILLHAATSAIAIAIRNAGLAVPLATCVTLVWAALLRVPKERPKALQEAGIGATTYVLLTWLFVILLWPAAWDNPLRTMIQSVLVMGEYPWYGTNLYFGETILASNIPWHYVPVWVVITTPAVILALALSGVGMHLVRFAGRLGPGHRDDVKPFSLFVAILSAIYALLVMMGRPTLYGGWRQCYFLYPCIVFFAVEALAWVLDRFREGRGRGLRWWGAAAVFVVCVLELGYTGIMMVRSHPHQYVHFTWFGRRALGASISTFDGDRWGVSVQSALRKLLAKSGQEDICVELVDTNIGARSTWMLSPSLRRRVLVSVPAARVFLPLTSRLERFIERRKHLGVDYIRETGCLVTHVPLTDADRAELLQLYPAHPYAQAVRLFYRASQGIGAEADYEVCFFTHDKQSDDEWGVVEITAAGERICAVRERRPAHQDRSR